MTLQLEWKGTYVSKEDPECWIILFAQLYRDFLSVFENKSLFQIWGLNRFLYRGGRLTGKFKPNSSYSRVFTVFLYLHNKSSS